MKPFNPVIPDYTPKGKKTPEEVTLTFKPCCICGKTVKGGYYGSWADGGTCSKTCETEKEGCDKYPDHPIPKELL